VLLVAAFAAACTGGGASGDPTPAPPTPTATPEPPDLTIFRGHSWPVDGACLPQSDLLMPNAPREYRAGVHEGVDMYGIDNCTEITIGTPVRASRDGTVARVDHDYHDLTPEELAAANERIAAGEANAPDVLDLFRGRQVWIDHGRGIVTRFAHLDGVAPGLREGAEVRRGDIIGFVGDSGTPESISRPDTEIHLHWELRVGETFLGAGLSPAEVRALYEAVFTPLQP
jgi:murein DD-endopeptidase MepM/ murein hydrolase activator NlpD